MHEILLFASVPAVQHHDLLQQLSGLTAMQPNPIFERHLVFKAYRKPGFIKARQGGSQDVQAHEIQRLNKMLNAGLYYMQVVGEVGAQDFGTHAPPPPASSSIPATSTSTSSDVTMHGTEAVVESSQEPQAKADTDTSSFASDRTWKVEFKDIPDAGTGSAVTSRFVGNAILPPGGVLPMMKTWGFE